MQTPLVLSLGTHWNRLGCYVWLGLIRFGPWSQLGQVRLLGQVRVGSSVARGGGGGQNFFLLAPGGRAIFCRAQGAGEPFFHHAMSFLKGRTT